MEPLMLQEAMVIGPSPGYPREASKVVAQRMVALGRWAGFGTATYLWRYRHLRASGRYYAKRRPWGVWLAGCRRCGLV
eukprot:scaffold226096_cov33-Tisochrysis_lutea.AAC.1